MKLIKHFYFQILLCILAGILLGHFYPHIAIKMKPLSELFIKLIRALVPFIIFSTVTMGIVNLNHSKKIGRLSVKAIIYFEVISTFALILGLVVTDYFQPGTGSNIDTHSLNISIIATYTSHATPFNINEFILNIIPNTLISAFTQDNNVQVLFVSILIGAGLLSAGESAKPITSLIEQLLPIWFTLIEWIMKLAPIAAFGAMSYTIGTHGIQALAALSKLLICFYLTCIFFIFVILNIIAKISGFSLWKFLNSIKEELLIVFGTATTEIVLTRMINKLEKFGCSRSVAGFLLPAGYAFNLDGMCIYLTMAIMFIAQVFHIDLTLQEQIIVIVTLMLTSKGAANVTGGGFIALATGISSMNNLIPIEGLVLLLGIDRFMSEARALTSLIGNGVATIVIAKWEDEFKDSEAISLVMPATHTPAKAGGKAGI